MELFRSEEMQLMQVHNTLVDVNFAWQQHNLIKLGKP
jgi:hypothetical protein